MSSNIPTVPQANTTIVQVPIRGDLLVPSSACRNNSLVSQLVRYGVGDREAGVLVDVAAPGGLAHAGDLGQTQRVAGLVPAADGAPAGPAHSVTSSSVITAISGGPKKTFRAFDLHRK